MSLGIGLGLGLRVGGGGSKYPRVVSASISADGDVLTLGFSESVAGHDGFTIDPSGGAAGLTYSSGDPGTSLVFDLDRVIEKGETVTLDYAAGDVEADGDGDDLQDFTGRSVANGSLAGEPAFVSAAIDVTGEVLSVTFDRAVDSDGTGFTLDATAGAVTASYASGTGTATLTFDLSRPAIAAETVTLSYDSGTGDVANAQDATAMGDLTDEPVTNNSTQTDPPPVGADGLLLEGGSDFLLLESADYLLLES